MRVVSDPLIPNRGFRIREGDAGKDVPARESDFCHCERGRESFRWWREGCAAPPGLLLFGFESCVRCEPETGLYRYQGFETVQGALDTTTGSIVSVVILNSSWSPPLFRRSFATDPEVRRALDEAAEHLRMRTARAEMVRNHR